MLSAGAVGSWFAYQRHLRDKDIEACFFGTDANACFRTAITAFRNGHIAEMDRLIVRHCVVRAGLERSSTSQAISEGANCLADMKGRVEAAAALQ